MNDVDRRSLDSLERMPSYRREDGGITIDLPVGMREERNPLNNGIRCDRCGVEFIPELRTRMEGNVEVTYFECNCDMVYEVCRMDPELRKLRRLIEARRDRIMTQRAKGILPTRARIDEYNRLAREFKAKADRLNNREVTRVEKE